MIIWENLIAIIYSFWAYTTVKLRALMREVRAPADPGWTSQVACIPAGDVLCHQPGAPLDVLTHSAPHRPDKIGRAHV